ncbi:hypothetical protein Ocin01_18028 [Orchesella cincta]|uniref:Uncharacterized protein n=1 Tax=Orchesella cincta TaxID=48709 RepID=A0A1D2M6Q4_ORCCI|nr:hypothetical protein Ocin01_18028 [Orchesella cincta]
MEEKKCKCNIWSNKFWNNFFHPRYPGVFLILVLVLLDIIYTCAFILISTYYENYSALQHYGNFFTVCATILIMIAGFLSIHFLTLKPNNMKLSYCIFLHVALAVAGLLGFLAIILLSCPPQSSEILAHTVRYVYIYHRAPYMMRSTFVEKECCGIEKFGDVFSKTETTIQVNSSSLELVTLLRIPPSCCQRRMLTECEKWTEILVTEHDFEMNNHMFLNTKPCFQPGENYDSLKTTETYKVYMNVIWSATGVYAFILGILAILNYHIWIVFSKVPLSVRPVKFNDDIRRFMTFRWFKKGQDALSKKRSTWGEKLEKTTSEFKKRHELVQETLSNYRTSTREQRDKDQREKQLLAMNMKSSHGLVPAAISSHS